MEHIKLKFGERDDGRPDLEPAHAEHMDATRWRLLHSPGWTYGIAAGDTFTLDAATGLFEVIQRSGNVVVRVFAETPVAEFADALVALVSQRLHGWVDGRITRAMVFTIPIGVGLPAIEQVLDTWSAERPGVVWEYGNVYGDDGEPLNWWLPEPQSQPRCDEQIPR